jgi:hypothetical protein
MSHRLPKPESATIVDRLISAATYPSFGMVGFVWLIASYILKKHLSEFARFHIYQGIFAALTLFIVTTVFGIGASLLMSIPFIEPYIRAIDLFIAKTPIYFTFTLWNFTVLAFIAYFSIGALLGKRSYVPFISDVINSNFGR